ncbi:MAG: hypothetical protein KAS32_17810 [Candidatus Peribacteraceae bacterium]|nr:hypothetical protein [Candidatus Peribacteraceae bacterium]
MAEKDLDYSQFETKEAVNENDILGQITILVDDLVEKDKQIAQAELALKKLKRQRDDIAENELPELMVSVGMTKLETRSGYPIKLEEQLFTNISKDRKPPAIAWLDKHGHGGMVSRNVVIGFAKTEQAKVDALLRLIGKPWPNHKTVLDVNANSVKALVKRLLDNGEEIDKEIFGVFTKNIVKISSK